jgi:rod shape-determining protein MreD
MVFLLALAGFLAIVAQMILPKLPFLEVKPYLIALPVLYAAMRLSGLRPFYLAIVLGSIIDILSPEKFGTGSVVLSVLIGLAWVQRENFPFDSIVSVAVLVPFATFIAYLLDYTLFCWQSGQWDWHFVIWVRFVWVSLLNLVMALPFFWIADLILVKWLKAPGEPALRTYAL